MMKAFEKAAREFHRVYSDKRHKTEQEAFDDALKAVAPLIPAACAELRPAPPK